MLELRKRFTHLLGNHMASETCPDSSTTEKDAFLLLELPEPLIDHIIDHLAAPFLTKKCVPIHVIPLALTCHSLRTAVARSVCKKIDWFPGRVLPDSPFSDMESWLRLARNDLREFTFLGMDSDLRYVAYETFISYPPPLKQVRLHRMEHESELPLVTQFLSAVRGTLVNAEMDMNSVEVIQAIAAAKLTCLQSLICEAPFASRYDVFCEFLRSTRDEDAETSSIVELTFSAYMPEMDGPANEIYNLPDGGKLMSELCPLVKVYTLDRCRSVEFLELFGCIFHNVHTLAFSVHFKKDNTRIPITISNILERCPDLVDVRIKCTGLVDPTPLALLKKTIEAAGRKLTLLSLCARRILTGNMPIIMPEVAQLTSIHLGGLIRDGREVIKLVTRCRNTLEKMYFCLYDPFTGEQSAVDWEALVQAFCSLRCLRELGLSALFRCEAMKRILTHGGSSITCFNAYLKLPASSSLNPPGYATNILEHLATHNTELRKVNFFVAYNSKCPSSESRPRPWESWTPHLRRLRAAIDFFKDQAWHCDFSNLTSRRVCEWEYP